MKQSEPPQLVRRPDRPTLQLSEIDLAAVAATLEPLDATIGELERMLKNWDDTTYRKGAA